MANIVILKGNLTRDPETKTFEGGGSVTECGIATNRRYQNFKTKEWTDEVTFTSFKISGKRGEAFAKFHSRGKPAFITGRLKTEKWKDKKDPSIERSKLVVVVDDWEFAGGDRTEEHSEAPDAGGAPWE